MAPRKQPSLTEQDGEAMEIHGFDLLAQVEAMLRHTREYQREVQRLRGMLGRGQTSTSERPPLHALRTQVDRLRRTWTDFGQTLADVEQLAGRL